MPGHSVLVYVSGHGFGHATRVACVLRSLAELRPDVTIHLRTTAPDFLFAQVNAPRTHAPVRLDVGTVQPDPFRLDLPATLSSLDRLEADRSRLVAAEVEFGRSVGATLCFVDSPPMACAVGAALGIPTVVMTNFTWDWIYGEYVDAFPRFAHWVDSARCDFALADVLLRLPMHGGLTHGHAFRRVVDVGLVARTTERTRDDVRRSLLARLGLGADDPRRIALVSLGGFRLETLPPPDVGPESGWLLVTFEPLPGAHLCPVLTLPTPSPIDHPDLVLAADVVIGKPGFGTVGECLAQGTPMLYADREQFREAEVLIHVIETQLGGRLIGREDLLAGRWLAHLERIPTGEKRPKACPAPGARQVAGHLSDWMERR